MTGPIISALPRTLGDLLSDKTDAARVAAAVDKLAGRPIDPAHLERSDWFDGRQPPWAPGVYEVEWLTCYPRFALFDGRMWRVAASADWFLDPDVQCEREANTVARALLQEDQASRPPEHWRGITEAQARALGLIAV